VAEWIGALIPQSLFSMRAGRHSARVAEGLLLTAAISYSVGYGLRLSFDPSPNVHSMLMAARSPTQ